jgi:hypothetical protein
MPTQPSTDRTRRGPRAWVALLVLTSGTLGPRVGLDAATAGERGLEIAREADRRDSGWGDQSADLRMVLRNRHGEESTREIRSLLLEGQGDGDKLLVVFDRPRDVQGTAFLTYTHPTGPDDQWLFLPALERVKRIASNNKSGPFMGSEFAYEDLASQEVEKYTHRYLRDERIDGRPAFVVERLPLDASSGYARQAVWYDQLEYRPERIEYYDRKNELLKTLTFRSYRRHLDRFWRADEMFMENHQTGKSTTLYWTRYQFRTGLSDRDFDQSSLKRAR